MPDPTPAILIDPAAALAIELASLLTSEFDCVSIAGQVEAVTVSLPLEPEIELEDHPCDTTRLWVIDFSEELASEHGISFEAIGLLICLQRKIDHRFDRSAQVADLKALASTIARRLRPLEPTEAPLLISDVATAACVKVTRSPRVNLDELRKNVFYTELMTVWKYA